jgi:uncharacterized damage-inducible protein DinB
VDFPECTAPADSRAEVFLRYLDYFRGVVLAKVGTLPDAERRASRLPSGWTPLELLKHLRFVELRWIFWGFEGGAVDDPWGDQRDGRWRLDPSDTFEGLASALTEQGGYTRRVVESHDLAEIGQPGPRWNGAEPASLERVLFHLVQEYARHAGHVDIVVELAGGRMGEG